MDAIIEISELAALPEGKPKAFFPKGLPVLIVRLGAEVFAVGNRCPHMGCPLSSGKLEGHILQCPCHDWRFDIRDGKFLDAPEISLKIYAVEINNGKAYVRLS